MKSVCILGSTGSVGQSTLKVLEQHKERFQVQALSAYSNVLLLAQQAKAACAKQAVIADESLYAELKDALGGSGIKAAAGRNALLEAASEPADWTMAAIVGMAGLEPLLKAIERGGRIAIANKEPLVSAGPLVMEAARQSGATLLPVDSEHNAIFQVFEPENKKSVTRLILTGSGGPFRTWTSDQIAQANLEQALNHPNWDMGQKITIDSATLMNKALEVIEAHYFFDVEPKKIEVLIHPQSIIHSMVEYADGSVLAQMGAPDMCIPIAQALGWPERMESPAQKLDFIQISSLEFEPVDHERFTSIGLAYEALEAGQTACAALNAANEVAVHAFIDGRIGFADITKLVGRAIETAEHSPLNRLDDILDFDKHMREQTEQAIVDFRKTTEAA